MLLLLISLDKFKFVVKVSEIINCKSSLPHVNETDPAVLRSCMSQINQQLHSNFTVVVKVAIQIKHAYLHVECQYKVSNKLSGLGGVAWTTS